MLITFCSILENIITAQGRGLFQDYYFRGRNLAGKVFTEFWPRSYGEKDIYFKAQQLAETVRDSGSGWQITEGWYSTHGWTESFYCHIRFRYCYSLFWTNIVYESFMRYSIWMAE